MPRARLGIWGLLLVPLIVFAIFTAAGVFVGRVAVPTYRATDILLNSGNCGFPSWPDGDFDSIFARSAKKLKDTLNARAYSSQCYNLSLNAVGCSAYAVRSLPYTVIDDAPCPFEGQGRCLIAS